MKKLNALFLGLILSGAMMAQAVTSVSPGVASEGSIVTLTIVCTGMNFTTTPSSFSVYLDDSATMGSTFNISSVGYNAVNSTTITSEFAIPSSVNPLGPYSVEVVDNLRGTTIYGLGKFRIRASTGISEIGVPGFGVYPIPAQGTLNIEAAAGQQFTELSLTSANGETVLKQPGSGNSYETLDIHRISAGIYILSVSDRTGAVSNKKIIVE